MIGRTPNPNCGNFFSGPKQEKVGFKLSYHKANYLHKKTLNDRRSRLQIQANTGQAGREDRGEVWQRRNGDNKEGDQRRRGEPSGTKGSADANQIVRSSNANTNTNISTNSYTDTTCTASTLHYTCQYKCQCKYKCKFKANHRGHKRTGRCKSGGLFERCKYDKVIILQIQLDNKTAKGIVVAQKVAVRKRRGSTLIQIFICWSRKDVARGQQGNTKHKANPCAKKSTLEGNEGGNVRKVEDKGSLGGVRANLFKPGNERDNENIKWDCDHQTCSEILWMIFHYFTVLWGFRRDWRWRGIQW